MNYACGLENMQIKNKNKHNLLVQNLFMWEEKHWKSNLT